MLPRSSISQFCPEIPRPQIQQNWVEATDVEIEDRITVSVRTGINQFAQETDARHGHGGRMCSVDCLNCGRIVRRLGLPKCAILTNSHYNELWGSELFWNDSPGFSVWPRFFAPMIAELAFQLVTGVLNVKGGVMQRKRTLTASASGSKGLPVGP